MLEVKGRAIVFWYWAGVGAVVSLLGWGSWDWFEDGGFMLRLLPLTLVITGVVFVVLGAWKMLDKRPVIVVDDKGFLDRTSLPRRLIAWDDIVRFRLITDAAQKPAWLGIDLTDPEKFISKSVYGSSAILEALYERYDTPCVIALNTLDIGPHSLLEQCKAALNQQKR